MADNVIVKPGVSGQPVQYDTSKVKLETVADELALLSLGDWEGLKVNINSGQYRKEIKELEDEWVDYLPRTDKVNNRKALSLMNLPGKTHKDNPSLAQACVEADRYINESIYLESACELSSVNLCFRFYDPSLDNKSLNQFMYAQYCNLRIRYFTS